MLLFSLWNWWLFIGWASSWFGEELSLHSLPSPPFARGCLVLSRETIPSRCVCKAKIPTPTLPSLGFSHFNWGFTHVHGCVCKTHTPLWDVSKEQGSCACTMMVFTTVAHRAYQSAAPELCPPPSGFLQQQSKTPREFFSASIKTCWDSLTLSPPSGIFPQENIKCMWLSWAFPELCEGLGSHPGGSASRPFMAFSNVFKWN